MNRKPFALLSAGALALVASPALADCPCGGAQPAVTYSQPAPTYSQPSYSQPAQPSYSQPSYSQPMSPCGSTSSYSQPAVSYSHSQPTASYGQPSYSQPSYSQSSGSVVQTGCSTPTPCGPSQSYAGSSYAAPTSSYPAETGGCSTCGSASVSYAQPAYSGGVVQTSGTADCGCSGSSVTTVGGTTSSFAPTTGYATPCGQSASVSYGQPSYGQPMSQGYTTSGYAPAPAGCTNCQQSPSYDGTSNLGGSTQNYSQGLQQQQVLRPEPMNSGAQPQMNRQPMNQRQFNQQQNQFNQQQDRATGSQDGQLQNRSEEVETGVEAPEEPGDIGGDEA